MENNEQGITEGIITIGGDATNKEIFWLSDWKGQAKGGIYWRGFELRKFIEKVESQIGKVVGIKIPYDKEDYNIEFITEENKK